jgi:hypothetical protein
MDGADGKKRRRRRLSLVDAPIGEDDDTGAIADGRFRLGHHPLQRRLQRRARGRGRRFIGNGEKCRDRHRRDAVEIEPLDRLQRRVLEDDAGQVQQAGLSRRLVEEVAAAAEEAVERHHLALAQRVDGWVRHLGESLPEIGVQRARPLGENGQRRIVAHRPGRLLPLGHRVDDEAEVLGGVAAGALQRQCPLIDASTNWRAVARGNVIEECRRVVGEVEADAFAR